jgi:hypothetical protein
MPPDSWSTLKMGAEYSCEILMSTYKMTRYHNLEDHSGPIFETKPLEYEEEIPFSQPQLAVPSLMELVVYHSFLTSPPLVLILGQLDPVCVLTAYSLNCPRSPPISTHVCLPNGVLYSNIPITICADFSFSSISAKISGPQKKYFESHERN